MIIGAIIALAAWGIVVLGWLIGTLELVNAERGKRRQQRQIEALDALYEIPSASHRGGRTR